MTNKFDILLEIVDQLRQEAPIGNRVYHCDESNDNAVEYARSRTFIHLYLKAKFGLENFKEREEFVTDGKYDGGLDAYYIDENQETIYLIQSKFRKTSLNFEKSEITVKELLSMEITSILKGKERDSNGDPFNSKIKSFQQKISKLKDRVKYDKKVIILANLTSVNNTKIKKLIDNNDYEIFDYKKTYSDLVFPLCTGMLFEPEEIIIKIDLKHKSKYELKQKIHTKFGDYNVIITFVPTYEIGKVLNKYKNSILVYNPRNYLSFKRNAVNTQIKDSIIKRTSNDFALLNNGITILADFAKTTDDYDEDEGELIIQNPQIINGGQTAYTLSEIYKLNTDQSKNLLTNKEVLVKIIFNQNQNFNNEFIKMISTATNLQTKVGEADQRSNDNIQKNIQSELYNKYEYFYERKKGEFYDGLQNGYLKREMIINREEFLRSYLAFTGNASDARRMSVDGLFSEKFFNKTLGNLSDIDKMMFAFMISKSINKFKRATGNVRNKSLKIALRYGRYAVIAAIGNSFSLSSKVDIDKEYIFHKSYVIALSFLGEWENFEEFAINQDHNDDYFPKGQKDFDNYYKGKTINDDIENYFIKPLEKYYKN